MKTTVLDLFATPVIQTKFDSHQKYVGEFADEYGNEWVKRMILEEFKHDGDQNENG